MRRILGIRGKFDARDCPVSVRRRIGPPPRMRPAAPARPVHAGRLPLWERLTFAVVFAMMVGLVVVITIAAAHP
jgi:hypothetical protein